MPDAAITPRLSRTAALVHALGLLAAASLVATLYFMNKQTREAFVIAGVASSAACVFIFWSLVLAVRAIMCGEKSRWPTAVLLLVLLEFGLPCLALWTLVLNAPQNSLLSFLIWLGLPVFGPFIAIGSLIAAPVAVWRARKSTANENAPGAKSWRSKKWKVWLAWYAGVMAGLGVILLPGPLYLLGAVGSQFHFENETGRAPENWGQYIGRNSPDFIRDGVGSLLDRFNTSLSRRLLETIDVQGLVSKKRLIAGLSDPRRGTAMYTPAWDGLVNSYSDEMPDLVNGILRGDISVPSRCTRMNVAGWIGQRGSSEQITLLLTGPMAAVYKSDRLFLIHNLWRRQDIEGAAKSLGDLAMAGELSNRELEMSFQIFAMQLSPQDQTKIWAHFLNASGATLDAAAARCYESVLRGNVDPSLMYLRHPNLKTRQITLYGLVQMRGGLQRDQFRNPKNADQLKLSRRLYELLDDPDPTTKLTAMSVLGDIFLENEGELLRYKIIAQLPGPGSATPHVLNAEETAQLEKVKSAVGEWLKENVPEK